MRRRAGELAGVGMSYCAICWPSMWWGATKISTLCGTEVMKRSHWRPFGTFGPWRSLRVGGVEAVGSEVGLAMLVVGLRRVHTGSDDTRPVDPVCLSRHESPACLSTLFVLRIGHIDVAPTIHRHARRSVKPRRVPLGIDCIGSPACASQRNERVFSSSVGDRQRRGRFARQQSLVDVSAA